MPTLLNVTTPAEILQFKDDAGSMLIDAVPPPDVDVIVGVYWLLTTAGDADGNGFVLENATTSGVKADWDTGINI